MTIESIDQDRIKVTVDRTDQLRYGINYETMTYSDINTRRLCEKIVRAANRKIGFTVDNARLLVEAKQDAQGTVILYLSRIPYEEETDEGKEDYFCQVVRFSDSSSLLDAVSLFSSVRELLVYSSLYEWDRSFFLYFEIYSTHRTANRLLRDVLEYGQRTLISKIWLDEHAVCISRDTALLRMMS